MKLFTVFHLNLAYSSIEEDRRAEVVERCYWPLLRLARSPGVAVGLEAPGYTLEAIDAIDPGWTAELRASIAEGRCELVGSGQNQLIGPLVPAEVGAANLRLGNETYERLLGVRPEVALVGEQAYADGLVPLYLDAGYRALVMEWDNPSRVHPEWPPETQYLPQQASGPADERIALLWNQSIAFQQFQRYAHGDLELDEYLRNLEARLPAAGDRVFALYGNDVEIFDFRPARYRTEAPLRGGEWARIGRLAEALVSDERFELVLPRDALEVRAAGGAPAPLRIATAAQPVAVKKQAKYNLTRWAVTGRDDTACNTACWRIYESLRARGGGEADWRELCYLWSSDFRTHITDARWSAFRERLAAAPVSPDVLAGATPFAARRPASSGALRTWRDGRLLCAEGETVALRLNCRRGLAVDALRLGPASQAPQVGTLPHGYYDDISLGADFYTGHLVLEVPGRPKITDLEPVEPEVAHEDGVLVVRGTIDTPAGAVRKILRLWDDPPRLEIEYELDDWELPPGSLRVGHVTLRPETFERDTLWLACRNGGFAAERFPLAGEAVDHGAPASALVSASHGLGLTDGRVELGDRHGGVRVEVDQCAESGIGLVTYREVAETFFCRLALSLRELDETCRPGQARRALRPRLAITALDR